jgi:hypothetical protein
MDRDQDRQAPEPQASPLDLLLFAAFVSVAAAANLLALGTALAVFVAWVMGAPISSHITGNGSEFGFY